MSTRWRVVDLSGYSGQVTTRSGRIIVREEEVPLDDVACILTGAETQWSGGLVAMAARYEVPILACDWRGIPHAVTTPWSSSSRVAARHTAQCDLSLPRAKNAWMQIIRAKIRGQANNLPEPAASRLAELARSVRSGDPQNLEARAARVYWHCLFPNEGFSRDQEGSGRNALLNYGYAVLRGHVIRAICIAGLMPALGIFHRSRANAFGLADDLIEPFRPAVDFTVTTLAVDATLEDGAVKKLLVGAVAAPMGTSGVSVASAINSLGQHFAMYCEGEKGRLTVPVWHRPGG